MLERDDLECITTADGSQTLFHRRLHVTYKSEHGAEQESNHIFLEGTNIKTIPENWNVLELGFGSARNFLQTFVLAEEQNVTLHYEALEWEPIPPDLIANIPQSAIAQTAAQTILEQVRQKAERTEVYFGEKKHCLVVHPFSYQKTLISRHFFHALFHDPFAPDVNEESWSVDYFRWAYGVLRKDGILATYSSAGHVRRNLAKAGFYVGVAKGPGKKREITLASAQEDRLSNCKIKNRPI